MTNERLQRMRSRHSLVSLLDHTDMLLERPGESGRVYVADRMPVPTNEFDIPQADKMVEALLGQMRTRDYVWTGAFDVHHMATPKADYSIAWGSDEEVGSAYRGIPALKVELPRQMHNLAHTVFELPPRPTTEVARQAIQEVMGVRRIQQAINIQLGSGTHDHRTSEMTLDAVSAAPDRIVGLIPAKADMLSMDFQELRFAIGSVLMVRRFPASKLVHPAIRKRPRAMSAAH